MMLNVSYQLDSLSNQPSPLRWAFFRLEKMIPVNDTSNAWRVALLFYSVELSQCYTLPRNTSKSMRVALCYFCNVTFLLQCYHNVTKFFAKK